MNMIYDEWKTRTSYDEYDGLETFIKDEMDKTRDEALARLSQCFAHLKKFPVKDFALTIIEASRECINESQSIVDYFDFTELETWALLEEFDSFKDAWKKDQQSAIDF